MLKQLKLPIVFILTLLSFIACDKDFNTLDSSVLGEENAHFLSDIDTINVSAYNKKLEALQIDNLPSNLLGVFNDPEYGRTTASIITQLAPSSTETSKINPVIDSVVINIPYFSTAINIDSNGNNIYQLDSVYGNPEAPIKLTIYRNNYFLRDFNPFENDISPLNYYSKAFDLLDPTHNYALNGSEEIDFDDHLGEIIIDTTFTPSNKIVTLTTGNEDDDTFSTTNFIPSFRVSFNDLNNDSDEIDFWQETIIDRFGELELSNTNRFNDYFRGLYFKAEAVGADGNMFLMDFESTNANITIYYTRGEDDSRIQDEYVLTFTGNKLNTFINNFDMLLEDGDDINGDNTLYLKGQEGSMAVIDLFGPDLDGDLVPDELDAFLREYRKTDDETGEFILDEDGSYVLNRLINEAHLVVYEDDSKVVSTLDDNGDAYHQYDRIYAYDTKNSTTTFDYAIDPIESTDPLFSKTFSLGLRNNISDTEVKYKIQLTEHINNIIQNDSTNYQIGLVMSNNVNLTTNSAILNSSDNVNVVPTASIITSRGTILYGSNEMVPDDKRLKLKIFFTKPN